MSAANPIIEPRHVCRTCHAVFRHRFPRCPLDGSELHRSDDDPLVGVTLAERYLIEDCIGEGGMGRVYRARHTRMSRRFAIKVLFGDLAADETSRQRFEREAEAASRLQHPNLVSVVDFGHTPGGLLYLAMELVPGHSLRTLINDQAPFSAERAVSIVRQLAAGLEHAHARGLVHRDFKPDNVLVTSTADGELAKILDFGIARILEDGTGKQLTTDGMVMGTPAFMSPEQAAGKSIDHRADLFALGMSMYEMLCGRLPFDGDPMAILHQNLAVEPPPMSERAGFPIEPTLQTLVSQLLAKQVEDRFQSARDLIDAIDDSLDELWGAQRSGRRPVATLTPTGPRPRSSTMHEVATAPKVMPGAGAAVDTGARTVAAEATPAPSAAVLSAPSAPVPVGSAPIPTVAAPAPSAPAVSQHTPISTTVGYGPTESVSQEVITDTAKTQEDAPPIGLSPGQAPDGARRSLMLVIALAGAAVILMLALLLGPFFDEAGPVAAAPPAPAAPPPPAAPLPPTRVKRPIAEAPSAPPEEPGAGKAIASATTPMPAEPERPEQAPPEQAQPEQTQPEQAQTRRRRRSPSTPSEPTPVTAASYGRLYAKTAEKYQQLFDKVPADSELKPDVVEIGRALEAVPFNPGPERLELEHKVLQRLERRISRLLRRAKRAP
ncbi:protein kinase domain-containing protein [Haliangium sp.]|uniref:serine/threonine protein kinase n=1 Tax=Haliangium sp. TaxID=2663208 RepID=UPI003D1514FB